jgi:hypothetical protein
MGRGVRVIGDPAYWRHAAAEFERNLRSGDERRT